MDEFTLEPGNPVVDEFGTPLTPGEIEALIASRRFVERLLRSYRGADNLWVSARSVMSMPRADGEPGRIVVSREVIQAAMRARAGG